MKQFTSEEIQDQFEKLPAELQAAVTSPEIQEKIEVIGKKHNLMIDQMGELVDEIGLILLGLEKSSDFVNHASQKLNISSKAALLLAKDINSEVFDSIKDSLRKVEAEIPVEESETQENHDQTVASIENAGNFSIEKEAGETNKGEVTYADRAKILNDLENPPTHTGATASNFSTPIVSGSKTGSGTAPENYTEPLVDYLLANPIAQSEKKIVVETKDTVPQAKIAPTTPVVPKKQGPDPYREAVK